MTEERHSLGAAVVVGELLESGDGDGFAELAAHRRGDLIFLDVVIAVVDQRIAAELHLDFHSDRIHPGQPAFDLEDEAVGNVLQTAVVDSAHLHLQRAAVMEFAEDGGVVALERYITETPEIAVGVVAEQLKHGLKIGFHIDAPAIPPEPEGIIDQHVVNGRKIKRNSFFDEVVADPFHLGFVESDADRVEFEHFRHHLNVDLGGERRFGIGRGAE